MTEIPPSRWKVVERGRRLEVIDTLSREPVRRGPAAPIAGRDRIGRALQAIRPRQTRFDGSAVLTTHPFYDDEGPRTIQLDAGSAAVIGRMKLGIGVALTALVLAAIAWPWLLVLLVPLLQANARRPVRRAVTGWLDRVETEAS